MSNRPHPQDGLWAWLGLIWATLFGVMVGCISFGFGVVLPALMLDLNENRERTALIGSLTFGVCVFTCVFFCRLCEKYSCRLISGFSALAYALGLVLSSFVRSVYLLYITYSVLIGLGAGASFAANFIHIRLYFKRWYSLAVGTIYAGAGIGMLSIGPIMQAMIARFGWRNAYRILAGPFVFLFLTVGVLDPNVEKHSEEPVQELQNGRAPSSISRKIVLGVFDLSVWRFPEFTLSAVATSFGVFGHYTALILLGQYSEDLGNSPDKSSILYLYLGIASVVARLISGRLCDHSSIQPRYVHQVGAILSGVSTILLSFAQNYTHLAIFAVFYGIADGVFQTTVAILFTTTVDLPRVPLAFGQANMVNAIPSAAGAPIAGISIEYIQKEDGISFGNFYERAEGKFFSKLGSLLSNQTSQSIDDCYFKCVQHKKCLSVNVIVLDKSYYGCQLLNWAGSNVEDYLVEKTNSSYIQMKTPCSPNPCQNGGKCTAIGGGTNYTCQCMNFTGRHCKDKLVLCALFDFESGNLDGWTLTGTAFNNQPTYGDNTFFRVGQRSNLKGNWFIGTYEDRSNPSRPEGKAQGDGPIGTMTSPLFQIHGSKLRFLIGGTSNVAHGCLELLIGGSVVNKAASGGNSNSLSQREFDVTSYKGQKAQIRIVDNSSGGWGVIMVDHIEDSCFY